jgi:hypothetical protein
MGSCTSSGKGKGMTTKSGGIRDIRKNKWGKVVEVTLDNGEKFQRDVEFNKLGMRIPNIYNLEYPDEEIENIAKKLDVSLDGYKFFDDVVTALADKYNTIVKIFNNSENKRR